MTSPDPFLLALRSGDVAPDTDPSTDVLGALSRLDRPTALAPADAADVDAALARLTDIPREPRGAALTWEARERRRYGKQDDGEGDE